MRPYLYGHAQSGQPDNQGLYALIVTNKSC